MVAEQKLDVDADVTAWSEIIFPHPTLSEAVAEAVTAAAGNPLHGG